MSEPTDSEARSEVPGQENVFGNKFLNLAVLLDRNLSRDDSTFWVGSTQVQQSSTLNQAREGQKEHT
jgi:hypothetical protein